MTIAFQMKYLATKETRAFDQFGGVYLPWEEDRLLRLEVEGQLPRPDGRIETVIMSRWYWSVLAWFVTRRGYELGDILETVEGFAEQYDYTQSLKWWLQVAHEEALQGDDIWS